MKKVQIFVAFPLKEAVEVLVKKLSLFTGIDIENQAHNIKAWNSQNYEGFTVNPNAENSSMIFPTFEKAESFKENKKNNGGIVWI